VRPFGLKTPPFRGPGGGVLPDSIAEAGYHRFGGVEQWVLLRAEHAGNPPLIMLHGGPGMSEAGFFRHCNAPLEKAFAVVNWDQRGAGKSFDPSIPKSSMTVEQFISDLDELVELVRRRLGKPKVVLFGHSWGSALGVLYTARFPHKVAVYVGSGQIGDWAAGERASYAYALAEAERRGWSKMVNALRTIGPPPHTPERLWVQRNALARLDGMMSPAAMLRMLRMVLSVPESSIFEVPTVFRSLRWSLEATWDEVTRLNLSTSAPALNVPVFFLLGRKDHWVSPELSVAYLEALHAPLKKLVWFEHSGHEPFADEPAKFNAVMLEDVLPVAAAQLA
jgi:pimeloyl-ACP methyl ester carboxylesterase